MYTIRLLLQTKLIYGGIDINKKIFMGCPLIIKLIYDELTVKTDDFFHLSLLYEFYSVCKVKCLKFLSDFSLFF